jgi:hypothetical protein
VSATVADDDLPDCPECETDVFVSGQCSRADHQCEFCGALIGDRVDTSIYGTRPYPSDGVIGQVALAVDARLEAAPNDSTTFRSRQLDVELDTTTVGHVLGLFADLRERSDVFRVYRASESTPYRWRVSR